MGAYDNPQAVRMKIDQGARNIAQFFTAMKGVSENIQRQAAINKKEAEKAASKKEQREYRALNKFDKDFAHLEDVAKKIGDFEVGGAKNVQDDAIMENLMAMRTEFLDRIADPDMSAAEVSKIQAEYDNKISIFKQDMDNFVAGYRVYKDIKDKNLGPNEEDAILSDPDAQFNEMLPIYESIYNGTGDVGIVPDANGRSFNIGKFDKQVDAQGNVTYGKPKIATSLTEYRNYAQKDPKNIKFFEQVEIFSPEQFKSRKEFLDAGLRRYQNSQYDFGTIEAQPVMVKDQNGNLVPKTQMKKIPDPKDKSKTIYSMEPVTEDQVTLDVNKLKAFRNTPEGIGFLLEGVKGQNPRSVFAGMGYDPATFTQDLFLDALTEDLITTYNQ
jgi:hypothetical protein|tara:strand:- start:7527 stop:8678 length:1152 start_codon:yes stop_codon:yes gene_type:complete